MESSPQHRAAYLGAVALALGIGAAIAAEAPRASADTSPGDSARSTPTASTQASSTRASSTRASRPARAAARPVPRSIAPVTTQPALTITRAGQSPLVLRSGSTGATELSGITYAGGTNYYAVGDDGAPTIWQVYTSLDSRSGRVRSTLLTGGISAPELGTDSEGIALGPSGNRVWVSDEVASTINEFSLETGQKTGSVAVPNIYRPANVQNNMGLESLTYGGGTLWTANEEALRSDGALSTTAAGSWVRIQEFDGPDLAARRQYAYRTDPISRLSPFVTVERSGLVDLLALPNGQVLALERELGGYLPRYRSRIYLVDFTGASDVAELSSLASGSGFTAVGKTLLWQGDTGFSNFEGITLGPPLSDGSYALLLVSDDGIGAMAQRQDSFSLILRGLTALAPAPTPIQV